MDNDNIREPDQYYMDTLLPTFHDIPHPNVTIRKPRKGKQRKNKMNIEDNQLNRQSIYIPPPELPIHSGFNEEEEIMKQSLLDYEEQQTRLLEEEIMKLSMQEYEEEQKKIEQRKLRDTIFENTKKQLDKLIKMDKNELYYIKIKEYIELYESGLNIMAIEQHEYNKFLKIIGQIRIPETEKKTWMEYISVSP